MTSTKHPARERIALAADLPLTEAQALYEKVAPYVGWAKVGLSLFVEHGPAAVEGFLRLGAKVFLDLKLHDIPNTVELAAARAAELGCGLLTVHASGGRAMLEAARSGVRAGAERKGLPVPRVLAVTVLTSLSDADAAGDRLRRDRGARGRPPRRPGPLGGDRRPRLLAPRGRGAAREVR